MVRRGSGYPRAVEDVLRLGWGYEAMKRGLEGSCGSGSKAPSVWVQRANFGSLDLVEQLGVTACICS